MTINPDKRPTALDLLQDEYFTSKGYTMDMFNEKISNVVLKDECYIPQSLNRPDYNTVVRKDVLDWLFGVAQLDDAQLKAPTIFLGIEIFDRAMNKWDKEIDQPNQLKYISLACLDIASKFFEIYPVDLELVYEYNNRQYFKKTLDEYRQNPESFDKRPTAPKITREDMKEFMIKVNKYEQKILFLLNFVVLTSTAFTRSKGDFSTAKLEVYQREIN